MNPSHQHQPSFSQPEPTTATTILIFLFGVFVFEFDENNGFSIENGYLENVFVFDFNVNFDYYGGLLDEPPYCTTPIAGPTDDNTPNPREFDILECENNDLSYVFVNEYEYEFDMILENFDGLLDDAAPYPLPQPTPHTSQTPYPTANPTPNPCEFCLLGVNMDMYKVYLNLKIFWKMNQMFIFNIL